jgi:hypothetical protein
MKKVSLVTAVLLAFVATVHAGGYFNEKTGEYEMPPPKITMEKNIPGEFYGEWCYTNEDSTDGSVGYRLPSWSEPGLCDKKAKLLNISEQDFSAENFNCAVKSKVKVIVIVDCAPSGCGTTAKFTASCFRGTDPKATSIFRVEIDRYKGNLGIKYSRK